MKRSIFFKIFAGYLFITLIFAASILLLSFRTIRNYHIDTLTDNLKNLGTTLSLQVMPYLESESFEQLDALTKDVGRRIQTRITVIDSQGVVLADSEREPESMENHRTRPEIVQALRGGIGRSVRFSTTVKEDMLYVALSLEDDGRVSGVLRVSLFLRDMNKLLNSLRMDLLYMAIGMVTISLLVALLFSRGLSQPIRELSDASRKVASGDFNVRVLLRNEDELKELAESFNYMTDQIQTLFSELSHRREELSSIISSLREGLIVLDRKGKVILSNESFRTIVEDDSIDGRFYWEVIREPEFGELVKRATDRRGNFVEEITLYDKVFLCSATFLESRQEAVVVFHDITEMKNLDKIKKDFVVNVSHELRTPLTAIKGFTETLEEEDENSKRYLDIIKRHTDRLINIVDDLLSLSGLEEKGVKLQTEKADLKSILENILKVFEQKAKEKNLLLKVYVDSNLCPVKADPYRLEQMFINLIDNAIKYTEKGEINISLRQEEEQVIIEIEDTGIGIAEEHLPRIFERFYVVDKSRSRRLGGTGLGLAIAKHIVLLHNGSIEVESNPGVGTKFRITLPVNPF
jgi:two-component system phosphate regulon sensor histidine kinase PhoR